MGSCLREVPCAVRVWWRGDPAAGHPFSQGEDAQACNPPPPPSPLLSQYNDLPTIIGRFIRYMSEVGVAEQPLPRGNSRAADLARL